MPNIAIEKFEDIYVLVKSWVADLLINQNPLKDRA